MAKYMLRTNYTQAGVGGLLAEGGSAREAALRETVESVGGTLEGFHYALGDCDLYLIVELPDGAASAAALALNISAAGGLTVSTTALMSAEDLDIAARTKVRYRAPGA